MPYTQNFQNHPKKTLYKSKQIIYENNHYAPVAQPDRATAF